MNRLFSVAILLATILSLFSCERDTGKDRLKVMAKENGVDWSVMERLVGDSLIDLTSEGNPCFLIGGIPFYASIHSDGIIGIRQDTDRCADSLSFADFLSVDYSLNDTFGPPEYSGFRQLFQSAAYLPGQEISSYLENHKNDNKGIDTLSLWRFLSLSSKDWIDRPSNDSSSAMRYAISFATDFEMSSIYVPAEGMAIMAGYHSSLNGVWLFCFGKMQR